MHATDFEHLELWAADARQTAHFYRMAFGFEIKHYAGLETGTRDRISFVLTQGDIRLIVTGPVGPDDEVQRHVTLHGDGVREIGLRVPDATRSFEVAIRHGAKPILEPTPIDGDPRRGVKSAVAVYGDLVHAFVQHGADPGTILSDYRPYPGSIPPPPRSPFRALDHLAICIEAGTLDRTVAFYCDALGFDFVYEEHVETGLTAMHSKVVQSPNGRVKLVLCENAPARRRGQIDEFITYNHGPGVQHFALTTDDIVGTVRMLRAVGVETLAAPPAYYDQIDARLGTAAGTEVPDSATLRELSILVDSDKWGYMLQCFTRALTGRPTMFAEVIERKDSRVFGTANVTALFRAVEQEQVARGTL